jgi:hypothetical protein
MYIAILFMRSGKMIEEKFDKYPSYSDILLRGYDDVHLLSYEVHY